MLQCKTELYCDINFCSIMELVELVTKMEVTVDCKLFRSFIARLSITWIKYVPIKNFVSMLDGLYLPTNEFEAYVYIHRAIHLIEVSNYNGLYYDRVMKQYLSMPNMASILSSDKYAWSTYIMGLPMLEHLDNDNYIQNMYAIVHTHAFRLAINYDADRVGPIYAAYAKMRGMICSYIVSNLIQMYNRVHEIRGFDYAYKEIMKVLRYFNFSYEEHLMLYHLRIPECSFMTFAVVQTMLSSLNDIDIVYDYICEIDHGNEYIVFNSVDCCALMFMLLDYVDDDDFTQYFWEQCSAIKFIVFKQKVFESRLVGMIEELYGYDNTVFDKLNLELDYSEIEAFDKKHKQPFTKKEYDVMVKVIKEIKNE